MLILFLLLAREYESQSLVRNFEIHPEKPCEEGHDFRVGVAKLR
jgi:hypothetical protein